jgi:hypothetical protein
MHYCVLILDYLTKRSFELLTLDCTLYLCHILNNPHLFQGGNICLKIEMSSKVHIQILHKDWTYFDWLIFGVWHHFQQYFSYIIVTSFSGGRSRSTQREPPTMGKQLVSFFLSLAAATHWATPTYFDKICILCKLELLLQINKTRNYNAFWRIFTELLEPLFI